MITLWHEERVDELGALVALDPDAICTNTPAVLRGLVDAPTILSPTRPGTQWRTDANHLGDSP